MNSTGSILRNCAESYVLCCRIEQHALHNLIYSSGVFDYDSTLLEEIRNVVREEKFVLSRTLKRMTGYEEEPDYLGDYLGDASPIR